MFKKNEIDDDLQNFTLRPEQIAAMEYIKRVKRESNKKFFFLNLPTGSGKSLLAVNSAKYFIDKINPTSKVDVITAGKVLQDQYSHTFESMSNLKGKDNYTCTQFTTSCQNGKEFAKIKKNKCDNCPYDAAKIAYMMGDLSLTNFHLYLINRIYKTQLFDSRISKLLIVDEAHLFDETISGFLAVKITENIIKRLKLQEEVEMISQLEDVTSVDDYISYIKRLHVCVQAAIDELGLNVTPNTDALNRHMNLDTILGDKNGDKELAKQIIELTSYEKKMEVFLSEYTANPDNWVMEITTNFKTKAKEIILEPIWAGEYLEKYVWSHYDMVILMSGTILNKEMFAQLNGIDPATAVYYSIPSPFSETKRPIYYMPMGKMTYNLKKDTFKNYVKNIPKLLNKYADHKGIIHTNSFELANWIALEIEDKRLVFHDGETRDRMLREYMEESNPTVFVSPSVSTGVSFDDELARFQIIAKIPYPSLSSEKNKIRKKLNPEWYSWATICGICQMYGRVVRSVDDWGHTIIIDGSFSDILKFNSKYIPDWILKSVKKVNFK